jgi:hypothetical protein
MSTYRPKVTYTPAELDAAALADLQSAADCSERQATEGPFYPERGITAESLRAYAAKCRATIEKYRSGGAHEAILRGTI